MRSANAAGVVVVPRSWVRVWPVVVGRGREARNEGACWVRKLE